MRLICAFSLEQHVRLLQQLNQAVPSNVLMLLADARKRSEKRQAKRIANRKSACTSRARKKALVKEMTELNAQLRRQALILSLIPDIVITIDESSKITFCSQQVERALGYEIDKITGATISEILIPESRDKLANLVSELLEGKKSKKKKRGCPRSRKSGKTSDTGNAVTENSFPLTVVDLGRAVAPSDENDASDTSASNAKQPSSLTNSSESNVSEGSEKKQAKSMKKDQPSSDMSHSSDEAVSKNLVQANANLERNVREHNTKMKKMKAAYQDDVTGAAVTANNASARLSSLEHHAGLSDDSGYRESNDSREEYSSSDGEKLIESQKSKLRQRILLSVLR
jgi:PAS domain S-box-containing protein